MKEKLLTATILLMTAFALIAYAESPEVFDLKYNPRPEDRVLRFEPNVELKTPDPVPYIKNGGYKNERIAYAWKISKDRDFVLTMHAECGSFNCEKHPLKYERKGQLWSDGFQCGISAYYHTSKFLKAKELHNEGNWQAIMDMCYDLYKAGTRFYGYDVRHERNTRRDGSQVIIFNN